MFPSELIPSTTMKSGNFRFANAEELKELLAVYWRDCRDVYVTSTMHCFYSSQETKR